MEEVHSLNGANCFIARELLYRVGGFDERLGRELQERPKTSIWRGGYRRSGFAWVTRETALFTTALTANVCAKTILSRVHRRQGRSRLLIRDRSLVYILGDLYGSYWKYLYHLLIGNKRGRYKSLGRVFHYTEMVRAKRAGVHKQPKNF